jgi:Arc/MetJ family transcription regulator
MLDAVPRLKTTVSIDRDTLANASQLLGLSSTSEVVDIALDRLVRSERLLRDLRGYLATPPTEDELLLGELEVRFDLGDDGVDYDAFYGGADAPG